MNWASTEDRPLPRRPDTTNTCVAAGEDISGEETERGVGLDRSIRGADALGEGKLDRGEGTGRLRTGNAS